ncbi:MAG: heme exporter protein CcmB [Sutterella sp.]|uniref:heme exporter protein CcmB n=1 Tax=Dakarella massiliensis TaxID=1506471 RepID=UPI00033CEF93|nr:heme exporter protein CcmB [Dakarella massiliensis]MBS6157233.1 heme exporter protein CcmB [Sutterella sp.]CDE46955.1 heme exporter protein CcmB [Sutterella sp. CAG:351]
MLKLFRVMVRRDLLLAYRQKSDVLQTVFFFLVVITLVPLGVGAETELLRSMAPGIVWVAALLAALLSLPRLFAHDFADGTLEQMVLSPDPLPVIVLAKAFAHWLTTGVPITVFASLAAVMFDLKAEVAAVLVFSLLIGTPVLSLLGSVGAALTLGLRSGGVLTSLLVLPLYIPVLIFGAGAAGAVAVAVSPAAYLLITGALSLFALAIAPWGSAAALRIALE